MEFACINFKDVFKEKSVKLKFTHSDKHIVMSVDSKAIGKIITAILNYVSGYAVSCVDVNLEGKDAELILQVNYDTYPVGDSHIDYMFKPFSQYTSTRSIGIGLSYARTLTQIHGGELEFSLENSKRQASFILKLPIEQSYRETENMKVDEVIVNSAQPLILIVEANPKLLTYLKNSLSRPSLPITNLLKNTLKRALNLQLFQVLS